MFNVAASREHSHCEEVQELRYLRLNEHIYDGGDRLSGVSMAGCGGARSRVAAVQNSGRMGGSKNLLAERWLKEGSASLKSEVTRTVMSICDGSRRSLSPA